MIRKIWLGGGIKGRLAGHECAPRYQKPERAGKSLKDDQNVLTTSFLPSMLQRMDNSWTNSERKTLELLVGTHISPEQETALGARLLFDNVCGRNKMGNIQI